MMDPGSAAHHARGALRSIRGTPQETEHAMNPLPIANDKTARFFHQWLETFAGYVREVDYASARPLFHPDVLAFGTHNDVIPGIEQWIATQWDKAGRRPPISVLCVSILRFSRHPTARWRS
jgi:hypothetical protein